MIVDKKENITQYKNLSSRFSIAIEFLQSTDLSKLKAGKVEIKGEEVFALVNEYTTKPKAESLAESHEKYIDLQYMVSGNEEFGYLPLTDQVPTKEYDIENDYMLFSHDGITMIPFTENMLAVFFPDDIHMPGVEHGNTQVIKKIVVKILIESK